eukprot:m.218945 g.218945  ORF g.218945 m.218945 type:complete len:209 (+) comp18691_c0_seq3:2191-2817(+)
MPLGQAARSAYDTLVSIASPREQLVDPHVPCSTPLCSPGSAISFANESQFLLVSHASMAEVEKGRRVAVHTLQLSVTIQLTPPHPNAQVNERRDDATAPAVPIDRFRGNFTVHCDTAFVEDNWASVVIGTQVFRVVGGCQRCQMVCVDQVIGSVSREPLRTLATFRRFRGRTFFGIHLVHDRDKSTAPYTIRSGMPLVAENHVDDEPG